MPIFAPDLQSETVGQNRTLTNAGLRSNLSYVKGIHNLKVGATYEQTFLDEHDNLGIVDPTFNAVCLNPMAAQHQSFGDEPSQCASWAVNPVSTACCRTI